MTRRCRRPTHISLALLTIGALTYVPTWPADRGEIDHETAVRLARQFLASEEDDEREQLRSRLDSFTGDIDGVMRALRPRVYPAVKPGYYPELKFSAERRHKKYPRDLLYFVVPSSYDPARPTGLIIFLHGGGLDTSRDAPEYTLRSAAPDSTETDRSGRMLAGTGMILSARPPGKGESYYRWCVKMPRDTSWT